MYDSLMSTKLLFFTYYLSWGAFSPYIARYMNKVGLSGKQIGILQGITALLAFLLPPLWGMFVDSRDDQKSVLTLILAGIGLGLICYYFSFSLTALLISTLVYALFNSPMMPFLDSVALEVADKTRIHYGSIRVFGSFGYAISASLMPYIYNRFANPGSIFPAALVFIVFALWANSRLPKEALPGFGRLKRPSFAKTTADFWKLIKNPTFIGLILTAFLHRIALVPYYNFFPLYLEKLSASSFLVGFASFMAILGEVVVLFNVNKMVKKLGAKRLLLTSLFLSIVRWLVYSVVKVPVILFGLQWLHGFSFVALHAVTIELVKRIAPPTMQVSAQSIYSAFNLGLGGFCGSLLMGALFDWFGGSGVLVSALGSLFLVSAIASSAALIVGIFFIRDGS